MSHASDLIATDIDAYLAQHERKELLRFLTCGSVDDGKSTLIGRLLHDTKLIYEDQLEAVRRDSVKMGTTGGEIDLALLVDGLKAEREQGITIDVAYRYFSTAKRKFIIADCPGHEQYTRNMATGASTCDLAIILVDARKGVVTQTKRHSFITSLLGIRHVIVAINKMDLVGWDEARFEEIKSDYTSFAAKMVAEDVRFIPMSALHGDNVVDKSVHSPWYAGAPLLDALENVHIASDRNLLDMRFPVQWVNRPNQDFRGFAGTVASGVIRAGDEVMVLPSRRRTKVKSVVTWEGELPEAFSPQAVTVTLEDEVDVSRGDMLVPPANVPRVSQRFDAMLVWMHDEPMAPGKTYWVKHTSRRVAGAVRDIRYKVDVNTLQREDASTLSLNEIGRCEVTVEAPIAFDDYRKNKATGAFILIDRVEHTTVAAGMILDRGTESAQAHWDTPPQTEGEAVAAASVVTDAERRRRFGHAPVTLLFTGLSGSGKSTLARAVERRLFDRGCGVAVLDGSAMRLGISKDLGFSPEERSENLRRGAEIAHVLNEAGMIALAAFLAPHEAVRMRAREVVGGERWLVVHLDAPPEVCRARDPQALEEVYEAPASADLVLPTAEWPVDRCVAAVIALLETRGVLR